jgi:flagellar biosynthesis/type III secretory pathway protein FliH
VTEIVKKSSEGQAPKVVTREVMAASAEAMRILEGAQAEAAEVRASVQQAIEDARQAGYAEGYEKGAAEWAEAIRVARASVVAAIEAAKPEIVRMALRVAEKVLRRRLEADPEAVVPMVDEALRSLSAQQQTRVVLRAHPADLAVLERRRQRWLERNPGLSSLQVVADETLSRGGCRIESEFGMVDATIDTQLQVIERHLLGGSER